MFDNIKKRFVKLWGNETSFFSKLVSKLVPACHWQIIINSFDHKNLVKINDSVMESSCICGQVKIPHRTMIYLERELAPNGRIVQRQRKKVVESCERLIIKNWKFLYKKSSY